MKHSKFLLFAFFILALNCQFLFSQEVKSFESTRLNLYNELTSADISLVNQKKKITLKILDNNVTLVVFLAGWCLPCGSQVIELNKLQKEFGKNRLKIFGLDTDDDPSEKKLIIKFIKTFKPVFPIGWTNEKMYKLFTEVSKFDGIPQTVVLYKGRIQGIFVGGGKTANEKLKEELKIIFSSFEKNK